MLNDSPKLKITIVGAGYVGLVTGACLSSVGHQVVCLEKDKKRVSRLKKGIIPIFEPGLEKMIEENVSAGRLSFTFNSSKAFLGSQIIFIAVGTPSSRRGNGYADLTYVYQVAEDIARHIKNYKVIVDKSTVPVGTADQVARIIKEKNPQAQFDMCSNPEFLREGMAISDFTNPDRVIMGVKSKKAQDLMRKVYAFVAKKKGSIFTTDIKTAELIKYASNSFLATKIGFINEMANLCEAVGANVLDVAFGMGLDNRIGSQFLEAGPGYGGSCFPKDVTALLRTAQENETPLRILESVNEANIAQKARMVKKITKELGDNLVGKTVLVLGLTFKPDTDDMRDAPALTIIPTLIEKGIKVIAHDPKGMKEAQTMLPNQVKFTKNIYQSVDQASALVLLTQWDEYKSLDYQKIVSKMKEPILIDLRNMFNKKNLEKMGFKYVGIGR